MAHQSLYRRYRPRRFGEVRGQDHVVTALRNAVANGSEGHAYLFSGPRGTGKTSTARILAKALNCDALVDGEPCCECGSCVEMEAGRSLDLFEVDAASHRGINEMKALLQGTIVGSPGRTKVYILDEVHALTADASNALLKSLEEPPTGVLFALATTDPQKVLPTIRSRTQHFEFQLLSADELDRQVRDILVDADLDVDDEAVSWVVHRGRGSSRDTLSALDQVVAAGGVVRREEPVEQLVEAIAARDTGRAILSVAEALSQGHDPRVLGASLLESLRDTFLVSLGVEVPHLMAEDQQRLEGWAAAIGNATLTRSMEALGAALVDARNAADPRVPLEVALVRLTSVGAGSDELLERIERLEATLASGSAPTAAPQAPATPNAAAPAAASSEAPASEAPTDDAPTDDAVAAGAGATRPPADAASGPAQARAELDRLRAARNGDAAAETESPPPGRIADPPPPAAPPPTRPVASTPAAPARPTAAATPAAPTRPPAPTPPSVPPRAPDSTSTTTPAAPAEPVPTDDAPTSSEPETPPTPDGELSVAELDRVVDEVVVPQLKAVPKAIFRDGHVGSVDGDSATFVVAVAATMSRAEQSRADVEVALSAHLGRTVRLRLVAGDGAAAAVRDDVAPTISGGSVDLSEPDEVVVDVDELEDATDVAATGVERLTRAFPGAVLIDEDEVIP